ncbi:MAG: hypothetical protein J2P38_11400 [Candidatus Dormibacteraeota bacterium]|nr:hypothetical protein [Candidatus Dormibacteraeota bacterium]
MPYIKAEQRPALDAHVDALVAAIEELPPEQRDGALNYATTRALKRLYPLSYYNLNRAMGVLGCIQAEFYRRVVAPYEDQKIVENGDV